jgi:hypothetical protein
VPYPFSVNPVSAHDCQLNWEQLSGLLGDDPTVVQTSPTGTTGGAAIQAAIDATPGTGGNDPLSGGVIWVPPGHYAVSTPIMLKEGISLRGAGKATRLQATGNNAILAANSGQYHLNVSDIAFDAVSPQTSGGAVDFSYCWGMSRVEGCYFGNNLYAGISLTPNSGGLGYQLNRLRWDDLDAAGAGVTGSHYGILISDNAHACLEVYMTDIYGTARTSSDMVTWVLGQSFCNTVHFTDTVFDIGANGIVFTGGAPPAGIKMANVVVDSMGTYGIALTSAREVSMVNVAAQTCGVGIYTATAATGIRISNSIVQNCGTHGLFIDSGSQFVTVNGVEAVGNNTTNTAGAAGIAIGVGVSDFAVTNCRSGNYLGSPVLQQYGMIVSAGASDYYTIANNQWVLNTVAGLVDGGTGTHKITTPNLTR